MPSPTSGVRGAVHGPADLQQRAVRGGGRRRRAGQLRAVRGHRWRRRRRRVRLGNAEARERGETSQRAGRRRRGRDVRGRLAVDQERAERQHPEQPVQQRLVRELAQRRGLRVGERGQVLGQQVRRADQAREDPVRGPHQEVLGRGAVVHHVRVQRREGAEAVPGGAPGGLHGQGRERRGRRQPRQGLDVRSRVSGQEDLSGTQLYLH